jgi:ectoine hydroxylase-related dioxygenase (phytanoyl-CoA dioxygenase family)
MNTFSKVDIANLNLTRDGAVYVHAALSPYLCDQFEVVLAINKRGQPGVRLMGCAQLAQLLENESAVASLVQTISGRQLKPVRAILFDKSPDNNWALGWHQDRTIVVKNRIEMAGYGPWTIKAGLQHVAPPFPVMERMVTVRIHLDDVPECNAPLLVALGSHSKGLIAEQNVADVVSFSTILRCLAVRGDVWLYSTPILHASERSRSLGQRRVLQVDYSDVNLPGDLEWLGI